MNVNKSLLAVLSMFLILLLFVSSASAADVNETDVLSVDESVNLENNTLALDAASNDNNVLENDNGITNNEDNLMMKESTYIDFVNQVRSGGAVTLQKALYKYNGAGEQINIMSGLTLDGDGSILDMSGSDFSIFYSVAVGNTITIKNLIIKNAKSSTFSPFNINKGSFIIENCIVENCSGKEGGAFRLADSQGEHVIRNCTFVNNHATNNGGVFYFENSKITMENCAFFNNVADGQGDVISGGAKTKPADNNWWGSNNPNFNDLIRGNKPNSCAILNGTTDTATIAPGSKAKLTYTFIDKNTAALLSGIPVRPIELSTTTGGQLDNTSGYLVNGEFSTEFTSNTPGDYTITAIVDGQTITTTITVTGGPTPVTGTWYVNATAPSGGDGKSPDTAFKTLNDALTNSELQDGNTIMIASGTYKGTDNTGLEISKNLNFIKYGDEEAIFDAENQRRIWAFTESSTNTNIIGLTFKKGNCNDDGGAILFKSGGSVTNCTFTQNTAEGSAGAIYFKSGGSVTNCTFTQNTGTYASGGAIRLATGGSVTNCTFTQNTANMGGAIIGVGGSVTNCTFTDNSASKGGAIIFPNFENNVTNCAFDNNHASESGDAVHFSTEVANMENNWWGSNNPDWAKLIYVAKGTVTSPASYAVLNLTADPNEIPSSGKSTITTKFVWNGTDTDATNSLPKRNVKLSSNGTLSETDGIVGLTSEFSATTGGIYYVNATVDNETIGVNVNVNGSVPKKDLNLNASTFTLGENVTIFVTGFENATGNITVTAGDDNYTSSIMMGMAFVSIPKSDKNITAYIYYPGDDKYNNASTTIDIIAKKDLNLTAVAEPVTVGENATIIVTGFENATGNVMVIAGRGFYNVTIMNGTAKAITKGLNNTTTAYILYLGDDNYNMAFTSVNITVNPNPDKKNLTLKGSAEPIIVGQNATIIVTGFENATGDVTARVEGGTLYSPIVNGTATFNVPGLTSSTTAYISYGGNDEYNAASTTVNITVIPKSDVVIVAENVTKYYHGPERFVANIYDSELNPMVNKSVNITINGVTYTKITDSNGTVSIGINLGSGTYDVITTVDNATVKSSITVLSTITGNDITKYYRNETQYSVQVFDTTGKAVGAGKVVTFNVNGRFYNRTTDENGIATLNINLPQGEYVITAINPVTGEMQSNNINVLPVVAAEDITMKYMDGTQFVATLVDGQGNPYKDQFVTFNVNGILYNRLTDSNGQAALNIRLIPGEYIITSSFNGCNVANKITVIGVL